MIVPSSFFTVTPAPGVMSLKPREIEAPVHGVPTAPPNRRPGSSAGVGSKRTLIAPVMESDRGSLTGASSPPHVGRRRDANAPMTAARLTEWTLRGVAPAVHGLAHLVQRRSAKVDSRGAEMLVAEHRLNHPQIVAVVEHVAGRRVTERMS